MEKKAVILGELPRLPYFEKFKYFGFVMEPDMGGNCADKGLTAHVWKKNGRVRERCEMCMMDADIVGVWEVKKPAPKVDWSKYPDYVKYLALDADGKWYGYTHVPLMGAMGFIPQEAAYGMMFELEDGADPKFSGDWEESLCVRPSVKGAKKPLIDVPWDKLPDWVEAVAYDKMGWTGFSYIPRKLAQIRGGSEENKWSRNYNNVDGKWELLENLSCKDLLLPVFPGNWEDSIIVRPGRNPIKDHE